MIDTLNNFTFQAKLTVSERLSKLGKPYKILEINYYNNNTGELLKIHEIYIKSNLAQVLAFVKELELE